jgi:hypothetical protein
VMDEELWQAASLRYRIIYEKISGEAFLPGDYPVDGRLFKNLIQAGVLK